MQDITNMGRWDSGNVEVNLESIEGLPYVIDLVRQALESELGEDDAEE